MAEAAQDHRLDLTTKNAAHRVERMLDDAVEDSFPASDPVALSMPHDRIESKLQAFGERIQVPSMSAMLVAGGVLLTAAAILVLRKSRLF